MKTVILAYRNNNVWKILRDDLYLLAKSKADKLKAELIVRIFEPTDEPETISEWIGSVTSKHEIVFRITDGTVGACIAQHGFEFDFNKDHNINQYLDFNGNKYLTMPIEDVIRTAYSRIDMALYPDLWIIVTNNITDYDQFGIIGEEKYGDKVTDAERDAYVNKFKSLIPKGRTTIVFPYSGYPQFPRLTFDRKVIFNKKVVIICHHHASLRIDPSPIDGSADGSICINLHPGAFLQSVNHLIQIDDLVSGDLIQLMKTRIANNISAI